MKTTRTAAGILRTGGVISMVAILVAGVTFAALRSQNNYINGSHLVSASANLQMSKEANGLYSSSLSGYNFFDLAPGGAAAPLSGNDVFFHNIGTTNLDMGVSLNPARLANYNGLNLNKVYLVIFDNDGVTQFVKYSLAELSTAYTTGTPLPLNLLLGKNTTANLKLRMQLDVGVGDSTGQAEIENMDYVFSGTAV